MARVGSWTGPTGQYGAPPSVVPPSDNVIEPTTAQAEADALAQQIRELEEAIHNAGRDPNAGNAKPPAPLK